jgi:hypothetical protein
VSLYPPDQHITFRPLGSGPLRESLAIGRIGFADSDASVRPIDSIERFVRQQGCETIAIEKHYVDRDYMEEHAVFYSRGLAQLSNYCERVHFFRGNQSQIADGLRALSLVASDADLYLRESVRFSHEQYLGFFVRRPLPGAPVGRTILRPPNDTRKLRFLRPSTSVHLKGLRLSLAGLPFQQQDMGVGACASIAVWTSLQNARAFETLRPVTPTHVTKFGWEFASPAGRAMPSTGLTIAQMCQAIRAVELAPNMLSGPDPDSIRRQMATVLSSKFAPIILLDCREHAPDSHHHAVVMAGYHLNGSYNVAEDADVRVCDLYSAVSTIYVHDDRIGPYIEAEIAEENRELILREKTNADCEREWRVRAVLVPLHEKVRLSFSALDFMLARIMEFSKIALDEAKTSGTIEIWPDVSIVLGVDYAAQLLETEEPAAVDGFLSTVALPRYVGVIRVGVRNSGVFDVLVDTTSTLRNPVFVRVAVLPNSQALTHNVADYVAKRLDAAVIHM